MKQQQRQQKQLRVSVEPSKEAQPLLPRCAALYFVLELPMAADVVAILRERRDVPSSDEEDDEQSDSTLFTTFILMIFFSLGNRLFGKLETYPMYNYPFFLNVVGVFIYVPICFLYIWPMQMFGKAITKEQR